jgi:hypothetical protein
MLSLKRLMESKLLIVFRILSSILAVVFGKHMGACLCIQQSVMYMDTDVMNTKVRKAHLLHQMRENKSSNVDKYFSAQ